MSDLAIVETLPDPHTGELLPATPLIAVDVWLEAAARIERLEEIKAACSAVLAAEGVRQGTKTLHVAGRKVTLTGGTSTTIDPHELMASLMEAGCPPDRVNDAVTETVSYKVNRAVLRQLRAANPAYAEAIDHAGREIPIPWKARVE